MDRWRSEAKAARLRFGSQMRGEHAQVCGPYLELGTLQWASASRAFSEQQTEKTDGSERNH